MSDDVVPPPTGTVDLGRYRARRALMRRLGRLGALEQAIGRRDVAAVWSIIDEPAMLRALPAVVREEAILISHLPARVHRAPVQLYRHQHALTQLGDDPLLIAWDEPVEPGAAAEQGPPPRPLDFLRHSR